MNFIRTASVVLLLGLASFAIAAEPGPIAPAAVPAAPVSAQAAAEARKSFEANYDAGTAAVLEKKWTVARLKLAQALKDLGEQDHPNKTSAQVLLNKADRIVVKDDMMYTAKELLRLKQWVEAEEAFRKVAEIIGETDELRNGVLAARAGLETESAPLKAANDLLRARKWTEAQAAYKTASETLGTIRAVQEGFNTAQAGAEAEQLLHRAPELLQRKQWNDAYKAYTRIGQILGETDEVKKGLVAAKAGLDDEQKPGTPAPAAK